MLPHDWLTARLSTDGIAGARHRPGRRVRHRLLVTVHRRLPHRPAAAGVRPGGGAAARWPRRRQPVGRTAAGAVLGPGTGDNMAAALGLGAVTGDVTVSIGTSRGGRRGGRDADRGRQRAGRRLRRRHRPVPAAGLHAQRGPGAQHHRRPCSASTWPGSTSWHCPLRARRAGAAAVPGRRAHPRPAGRARPADRADPGQRHAGAAGPGGGGGAAVRAGRRAGRAAGAGGADPAGRC